MRLKVSIPSFRVRRICKGWVIDQRRMRLMDNILAEAAVEIEDGLAEDEVPIFNWMMSEDKRTQSDLARQRGLTKGNLSKIKGRIADKSMEWCNRNGKI
jgi:DNA-binding MarR family transcriptional regulator